MHQVVEINSTRYAFFDERDLTPAFLSNIAAEQIQTPINRNRCNLAVAGTITIDGSRRIKSLTCKTEDCDKTDCVFNRK